MHGRTCQATLEIKGKKSTSLLYVFLCFEIKCETLTLVSPVYIVDSLVQRKTALLHYLPDNFQTDPDLSDMNVLN